MKGLPAVTLPFPRRRTSRPRGRAQLALTGDFPDDRDIADTLAAVGPPDWDGTTITFGGASGTGLDPAAVYSAPAPLAIAPPPKEEAETSELYNKRARRVVGPPADGAAPFTWLRADGRRPAMFPALPAAGPPVTFQAGAPDDDGNSIARDMTRGWPHLFEVRCAYPAAASDTPIPCGAAHRDEDARSFRDLRRSAQADGWHLDAFGRWACPRCCQDSPEYRTLYALAHYHPHAANVRLAGDTAAEFALRVTAEHNLLRDVRDTARHGRHQAGAL
jgi:hypothetical protein